MGNKWVSHSTISSSILCNYVLNDRLVIFKAFWYILLQLTDYFSVDVQFLEKKNDMKMTKTTHYVQII